MISVKLFFPGDADWTDVSSLVKPETINAHFVLFNSKFKSVIDSYDFELKYSAAVNQKFYSSNGKILCQIEKDSSPEFTGYITTELEQTSLTYVTPLKLQAFDNSWLLDETISESFEFPSAIGGSPFKIFDATDTSHSIVHQILIKAGYTIATDINSACPQITETVQHIAGEAGKGSYRNILDTLLSEFGYVLTCLRNGQFLIIQICKEIVTPEHTLNNDLGMITGLKVSKGFWQYDGIKLKWASLATVDDMLVYRFSLPLILQDGVYQYTGKAVAAGDYYPADSDIEDIYQSFKTDWLDTPYLSRETRLENEDLSIISTSNHDVSFDADSGFEIASQSFEPKRAKVSFQNTAAESGKIYTGEIKASVLYRETIKEVTVPEAATNPEEYTSEHLFDSAQAQKNAIWRYRTKSFGIFNYFFQKRKSEGLLPLGMVVQVVRDDPNIDTTVIIYDQQYSDHTPMATYKAIAITAYATENVTTSGNTAVVKPITDLSNAADILNQGSDGFGNTLAGKTLIPEPVTITSVEALYKAAALGFQSQPNLTNFSHYEITVCGDDNGDADLEWKEPRFDGIDWKYDTPQRPDMPWVDWPTEYFQHSNLKLTGTIDEPETLKLYYKVRRVTKKYDKSEWSAIVSVAVTGIDAGEIVAKAIKNAKLDDDCVTFDKLAVLSRTLSIRGLIAYYTCDDGKGTTLKDTSDNGNDGTLVGFGPVAEYHFDGNLNDETGNHDAIVISGAPTFLNGAIVFDYSNGDQISFGASVDFVNDIGWSATAILKAGALGSFNIFFRDSVDFQRLAFYVRHTAGLDVAAIFVDSTGNKYGVTSGTIDYSKDNRLTVTFDGSSLSIYVNKIYVGSDGVPETGTPPTGSLITGASPTNGDYCQGNTRFFDYCLSQAEIDALVDRPYQPSHWVDGISGKALNFNGKNSVEIKPFEIPDVLTFCFWTGADAKVGSPSGSYIFDAYASGRRLIIFKSINLTKQFGVYVDSGFNYFSSSHYVSELSFVAITIDGALASLYINGDFKETITLSVPFSGFTPTRVAIGSRYEGYSYYLVGVLDEVRFYSAKLTLAQIRTLAENPGGGPKGLITAEQIAVATIIAINIAANAVTTDKIETAAVTADKMATSAVSSKAKVTNESSENYGKPNSDIDLDSGKQIYYDANGNEKLILDPVTGTFKFVGTIEIGSNSLGTDGELIPTTTELDSASSVASSAQTDAIQALVNAAHADFIASLSYETAAVFSDGFNYAVENFPYTLYSGSGELSIDESSASELGGNVLTRGNNDGDDERRDVHNINIPFDSTRLYRFRCRIRRTAGSGSVYLGFSGVAADGVTWVNYNGNNTTTAAQHYLLAAGSSPTSWTEYVGYVKGFSQTENSPSTDPANPRGVHPNVRYMRPHILTGFSGQAGIYEIDYFIIEDYTDAYAAQTTADNAQSTANTAQSDATQAISDAASAQATADVAEIVADSKTQTYRQAIAPTSPNLDDRWIDTDNNDLEQVYTPSGWSSVSLKSSNYSAGSNGWQILNSGDVEFNNGTFRGDLSILSDDKNRSLELGSKGLLVKDVNGKIIHDLPDAAVISGNFYLGHLLWLSDQSSYQLIDSTSYAPNTWIDLPCVTVSNTNIKGGIFKCYLNSDNGDSGVTEPYNRIWLRPKGTSWVADATSNTPEGRLYLEDKTGGMDSIASVYFLICPIGIDNSIQFNADAGPSGNYQRVVINQLGIII